MEGFLVWFIKYIRPIRNIARFFLIFVSQVRLDDSGICNKVIAILNSPSLCTLQKVLHRLAILFPLPFKAIHICYNDGIFWKQERPNTAARITELQNNIEHSFS